jgi:peptidoglycan/xylan/chitin deacetylase (PgdA/CDA1 family)
MRRLILLWNLAAPLLVVALFAGGWGNGPLMLAVLASAHWPWLYATLRPGSEWWGPQVRGLPPGDRAVWLTIDDGPDPVDTPVLLDLLDAAGAKVTFFVIGDKVGRHPELVREILRRGHELGNHTMTHPAGWFWALPNGRVREEVRRCQEVVREVTGGYECRWFRAPAGLRNHAVHPVLEEMGMGLAGWTVRGFDGVSSDAERVVRRLREGLRDGAGVLMHEGRAVRDGSRLGPAVLAGVLREMERVGLGAGRPGHQGR